MAGPSSAPTCQPPIGPADLSSQVKLEYWSGSRRLWRTRARPFHANCGGSAGGERLASVHADGQGRRLRPEAPNVGPLLGQGSIEDSQVGREDDAGLVTRALRPEPEVVLGGGIRPGRDMTEEWVRRDARRLVARRVEDRAVREDGARRRWGWIATLQIHQGGVPCAVDVGPVERVREVLEQVPGGKLTRAEVAVAVRGGGPGRVRQPADRLRGQRHRVDRYEDVVVRTPRHEGARWALGRVGRLRVVEVSECRPPELVREHDRVVEEVQRPVGEVALEELPEAERIPRVVRVLRVRVGGLWAAPRGRPAEVEEVAVDGDSVAGDPAGEADPRQALLDYVLEDR